MDTHLTLINEGIVREREAALRRLEERSGDHRIPDSTATNVPTAASRDRPRRHLVPSAELVVVTMFAVLAAGLVSLVVSGLRI